jgi:hypothetical protein
MYLYGGLYVFLLVIYSRFSIEREGVSEGTVGSLEIQKRKKVRRRV